MIRRLFVTLLLAGVLSLIGAEARCGSPGVDTLLAQEAQAAACRKAPTRRCVADLALDAALQFEDPMWRGWSLGRAAEVYARMGDIEPVAAAVANLDDVQLQVRFYAQLGAAVVKVNKRAARQAFHSAIKAADSVSEPMLHLIAYANIAIQTVAAGDQDSTREVVDAAVLLAGSYPDLLAKFGIARAQVEVGDIDQVLATAEEVVDKTSDIGAIVQIAEIQAKAGRADRARSAISRALRVAREISSNDYDHQSMEHGCSAHMGNRDAAMGQIFATQLTTGDVESALQTARDIEDSYARAKTLAEHAVWPDKAVNAKSILSIIRTALPAAESIEIGECRNGVMSSIVVAQAKAGDFKGALATAKASGIAEAGSAAIDQIVDAWVKAGRKAPAAGTTDAYFRAEILVAIARQKATSGDLKAAHKGIDAALAALSEINEANQRGVVTTHIAGVEALLGDVDAVRRRMGTATDETDDADSARRRLTALSLISLAQAKSGQFVAALATADGLNDPWARLDALVEIAGALPR